MLRRLCVFDLDGTLGLLTGGADDRWYAEALRSHFGDVPIDTTWESYPHVTDHGIVRSLALEHHGREATQDDHDAVCGAFLRRLEAGVAAGETDFVPVPGAHDAVRALPAEHGWEIALATGGWRRSALWKLTRGGFDLVGRAQAFADDGPARQDVLRTALARAHSQVGGDFERVVYVGDGVWDVRTCRALGWPFVGVAAGHAPADRLRAIGASHVLSDLSDLDELLRALAEAEPPTGSAA